MSTIQEQLREAMSGVEVRPRGNLEAAPEVDTANMVDFLSGKQPAEEQDDEVEEIKVGEPEEEENTEVQEEGEREPVKLADLADLLEWTPEAVYGVQIPLDDGETITLGEAKDRIKESLAITSTREQAEQELAERKEAYDTQMARLQEQVQMAAPAELISAEAALQRANDEYNRIDWVNLETGNPGQAALTRQKLTEEIRQAQQRRDGIKSNIEALQGDLQQQQQRAMQEHLQQARHELHRLIPDWANEAKFNAEREQLISYGIGEGIDEATLRSVADPKIIAYLYKNWQRDKKLEAAKPVEKPPKVLKPQAAVNRSKGRKAKVSTMVNQAKQSNDPRDKVGAIAQLLRNQHG